jgi:hypothetical protein
MWSMEGKKNKLIVLMAALAASAIYNIAHGLRTGKIYGKTNWIALADDPERFWNNVIGNALAVVVFVAMLWVLRFRSR